MLTRLRSLLPWPGRAGRHPDLAELLAWIDGELDPRRAARAGEHIPRCPQCRLEVRRLRLRLEQSSRIFQQAADPPPADPGARRLLRMLRNDALVAAAQAQMRERRNSRLVAELGPYFGVYPISLLERSSEEAAAFPERMDRLASAFLGRKAAAAMFDRINLEGEAV